MSILSITHRTGRGLFLIITLLMAFILMDTFLIKFYDTIDKNMIPLMVKKIIFSVVSFLCIILQLYVLNYLKQLTLKTKTGRKVKVELISKIVRVSQYFIMVILAFMIFQLFYFNYYSSLLLILVIGITYGTASILILNTARSFISWYKLNHNFIFLLYSISLGLIGLNLILTSITVDMILSEKPVQIREFAGGSMDISGGKYKVLSNVVKISSIISFVGIWITTASLMHTTTDRIRKKIRYWIILSTPLVYFLLGYFVQDVFGTVLFSYFSSNPIVIALFLSSIFILSKPIGGLIFGLLFWRTSGLVKFDRTLREYMIISGYGFLLFFSANQASLLALGPYPPFGTITITVLILASYLILIGIFGSATLVSANIELRKYIYNTVKDTKFLNLLGKVEVEKQIKRTVTKIINDTNASDTFQNVDLDLDVNDINRYIESVIGELKNVERHKSG